jgi:hypothetical protein
MMEYIFGHIGTINEPANDSNTFILAGVNETDVRVIHLMKGIEYAKSQYVTNP